MAGGAYRDGDALPLDGSYRRGLELAEGVWADEDRVAGVDDASFHDAGHDGADEGDGEGVVDVELEGGRGVVMTVVGEDVEEGSDQVQTFTCYVADLEDGADALGDEGCGGVDRVLARFNEDGDLAGAWGLENAGQLHYGLLEDLGWADVNFGDHDHDGDVQCKSDTKVFF